jgi:hypothetical protein
MAAKKTGLKVSDMTDSQRKQVGQRVVKMKKAGQGWPEIIAATGIAGGLTGRKLMREFGGASAEKLIRTSYDRSKVSKPAKKATASKPARSSARAKTRVKGKATSKARGGRSRTRA